MFLRVNGLFGHVKQNDVRSIVAFLGFAVAIQVMAASVLLVPTLFIDMRHNPLFAPTAYLFRYGSAVMLIACGLFVWRYDRYIADVEDAMGFGLMPIGSQRLRRVVAEMAATAGIACPRVAIIESSALNAFACGTKPENSIVVATRGLIDTLDDRELRAVVAHEVTHIKNGDIRFMASAQVLFGILEGLQRFNKFKLKKTRRNWFALAAPALYILPAIASAAAGLAFMIGRMTRSGVSLSREFIADAEAVRLSQDAGALVSALRKVEGRSRVEGLRPQFEAMMIDGMALGSNPTHPPMSERIAALLRLAGPMAAERYVSAPVTPSQRGFGRKASGSPFTQTAASAFAGMASGELTPEEEYLKRVWSPPKRRISPGILFPLAIVPLIMAFLGSLMPDPKPATTAPAIKQAARVRTAGCFPEVVGVAADRLYPVSLNPDLIEMYRMHRDRGDGIAFENYVAMHRASVMDTQLTSAMTRDAALMDYAAKRKLHLDSAALFFGADGLRSMRGEYDGASDKALLAEIKARMASSTPLPGNAEVTRAELATLAAHPERFVPCRAPTQRDDVT